MLLSTTFETWNQEDLEHGDTDKKGFIFQNEEYSFNDLLEELEDECYHHLSNSILDSSTWISTDSNIDYRSGEETIYSLHFNGTDRQKKYWIKALKIHLEIKD
tara:strand:+ start:2886 stop:3194 length:309 start_codon:yes stop_codon:yes gene_type:complete